MAARLITLGRVAAPWGVKGWIRVAPFADAPIDICHFAHWWVKRNGGWQEFEVVAARPHGASVIARLAGCDDRDIAAALKGSEIAVPRDALPPPGRDEVYWADLVGLKVVNLQGEVLGEVAEVMATGANDVLRLVSAEAERLVPYVAHVIGEVDLARGVIRADWELDW